MDKNEALRLALEALEEPNEHVAKHRRLEAINAIKEALAQPEPVQVTINDFVAFVKDKEDWVGRPVYWAQWPNEEKNGC